MKYSSDKEINDLVSKKVKQGWFFFRGGKHGRLRHPQGRVTVTVPSTPGDYRSAKNFASYIRRAMSIRKKN